MLLMAACGGGGGSTPDTPSVDAHRTAAGSASESAPIPPVPAATVASAPAPALVPDAPVAGPAPGSTPPPTSTEVTVRAYARGHGVEAAAVELRIAGRVIGHLSIGATSPTDYVVPLSTSPMPGVFELFYKNASPEAGRSLTVLGISLHGTTLTPQDNGAVFDAGVGPASSDGLDLQPAMSTLIRAGALRFSWTSLQPASAVSIASNSGAALAAASAKGYYIDAERGDDGFAGTAEHPWRTLSRATAVRLAVGEGLFLRCGSVWRGALLLGSTQLRDASFIAGYGRECATRKAVISGADNFTGGWERQGSLWSRALPVGTPKIAQLFIEGHAMRTAQWPNVINGSTRLAMANQTSASDSALEASGADIAALSGQDLTGATAQLRTQPWMIETRRVTGHLNGRLQFDRKTDWPIDGGEAYVLQDKRWMLDQAGEFFHDTSTQRLWLMPPLAGVPDDVNAAQIEGSVRDTVLTLTGRRDLMVRDVSVRFSRTDGFRADDAPGLQLVRIESRDNAGAGIRATRGSSASTGLAGLTVIDSLVSGNGESAVDAWLTERAVISHNRVYSTGSGNQHRSPVFAAISAGDGSTIENNTVDNTGSTGIRFSSVGESKVIGNTVAGWCRRLTDCGAIYTWTDIAQAPSAAGSRVEANHVMGAQAAAEGAVAPGADLLAGIYIDDRSHGATVLNNTVSGAPVGIFLHNASRSRVSGNRLWLSTRTALAVLMDRNDLDTMVDNIYDDNEIVPLVRASVPREAGSIGLPAFVASQTVWFTHMMSGAAALTPGRNHFRDNTVRLLQGTFASQVRLQGPDGEVFLDGVGWSTLNPLEPKPQHGPQFSPVVPTTGADLVADGAFDAGLASWRHWRHPDSQQFSFEPRSGLGGCDGLCTMFTAGHPGDLLASAPFALTPGAIYLYRWTSVMPAAGPAMVGLPSINREASPWDSLADAKGYVGYHARQAGAREALLQEAYFRARDAGPARVHLQLESLGTAVGIDGVSVRQVTGWQVAAVDDWASVARARMGEERLVGCAELGWPDHCQVADTAGRPVALPVRLAAGEQRLYVRSDSAFRR